MSTLKASRKPVNLFFFEIIISLLVFSVSGAVILRVFAAADAKSRRSAMLENVVITAQSIAEVYSQCADASEAVGTVLGTGGTIDPEAISLENGKVTLAFSENRTNTGAGELRSLIMRFAAADGELLYSLECSAYVSGGVTHE